MGRRKLKELQERIGYRFQREELLHQALSHSSYVNEHRQEAGGDNERLEFLGDAVLELSSSEFLYLEYPEMPEGDMTKLRASLVCEPTLAMCAREMNLPDYLLLGKGEEHTGGRFRDSIVSDALEALLGAIYLDGGFASAKEFVKKWILTDIEHKKLFYDSKTILQEMAQRDYRDQEVSYVLVGEEGPDHAKQFIAEVRIGGKTLGRGRGSTKKGAEQEAAYRAIILLKGKDTCI
ncbi:MAG TPA: ribonuclease III [Candidatus Merdiplasma excrementigallinarum]|uniref:Ribonuclease 3 n=1 Tax=Candidatus Merdiplasma excrementigallinarum TaxID=2840864 RepID=A0A9D1NZ81_9FIRM|nr:ribonuclease III [Candidatus Merdiplasma excrementigallinarum]